MKKLIYTLLFVLTISCSKDSVNEIEYDYIFNQSELELIDKINQHRLTHNLFQLNILPHLGYLCSKNNEDMIEIGNLCNCYLNQSANSIYRLYGTQYVSQIALAGYINNETAMTGIMSNNSSKNMIEGDYTDIGVSISSHPITGTKYYTILLIRR